MKALFFNLNQLWCMPKHLIYLLAYCFHIADDCSKVITEIVLSVQMCKQHSS